jgi:Nif-specific regulatory protein
MDENVSMLTESTSAFMQREVNELRLLFEIAQALNRNPDLSTVLRPVLERMAQFMGLVRATVTILNRESGSIHIDMATGLSPKELERGRYRLGEGITGRVVETGEPAIVEKVSKDPRFLDKTQTRRREMERLKKELSFVCVPIRAMDEVIGALSADREFKEDISLSEDVRLLLLVASLISQAVVIRRDALEQVRILADENVRLQGEITDRMRASKIVGSSHAIRQVHQLIHQVADTDTTVLIRGESGVGKELVAEALHVNGKRARRPFIKISLAAVPETMIESELFGHERGAFTGATHSRQGRFEAADGGTIFLDEIGDLPLAIQIKILRLLQERQFERLGSNVTKSVDVRVIAATNRDLETMVQQGAFRPDLYFRLNVFPIYVPPLRERRTDITLLADYFIGKISFKTGKEIKRISTPAIDMLMHYHWPGNVRELQNCIERAIILSSDGIIHGHQLPPSLQTAKESNTPPQGKLLAALKALEHEMIADALKSSNGNMAKAARLLGITERLMGIRVKTFGIDMRRLSVSLPPTHEKTSDFKKSI